MAACADCGDSHSFFALSCSRASATEANREWLFTAWAVAFSKKFVNGGIMNALTKLKGEWAGSGPNDGQSRDYLAAYGRWKEFHSATQKEACAKIASTDKAGRPDLMKALAENQGLAQVIDPI